MHRIVHGSVKEPTARPLVLKWGGLTACQALGKGCFVFKVTRFEVTIFSIFGAAAKVL